MLVIGGVVSVIGGFGMHDKINKFFRVLKETKEPAYDVETDGLDWKKCTICGYSVSDGKESVYIPVRHKGGFNTPDVDSFEHDLMVAIAGHSGKIVGHNIKFDAHFSENHGIKLGNKVVDTMVNEALLDEHQRSYSLENVCKRYDITPKLGKRLYEHISQQVGCKPDRSAMGHYHRLAGNDPLAVEYAEGDTLTTSQLYEKQKKELYAQQLDVVHNLESELTYVLQKMERRGIKVDLQEAESVKVKIEEMHDLAYSKLIVATEDDFGYSFINVRSAKDLKEYFEMCDIDDWPMTLPTQRYPDGQPSFNKDFLATTEEGLNVMNVRKLAHLKSSFLDVLDKHIHKSRIHTTFNQTIGETHGTRFGRLSSSNPNKQQVPKRDKQLGEIYRRMFVPNDNYILIEYDYSQAEPRLYAHYSDEPALIKGYNSIPYIDMHKIASDLMGVSRDIAKNLNLGKIYTMGPKKLALKLGISYDQAKDISNKWDATFPRVSNYDKYNPGFTQKAQRVAEDRGYVKTILGRRARFPDPTYAYRAANRIIQGGSADILKFKMVEIDRYLVINKLEDVCRMLLTIHDSLVFEIHKERLDLIPIIAALLERVQVPPFNLKIPFVADYKSGENWSEATYGKAA